jgi:hypothetical protein
MMRGISLLVVCFTFAFMATIGSLGATPLSTAAKDMANAAAATDATQRVHGCHAFCRRGPAGWHRHGPRCGRWRC